MSSKNMEISIAWFDLLVTTAAHHHFQTWCVKRQVPVLTRNLRGRECCPCRHYIGNGGVCDPL